MHIFLDRKYAWIPTKLKLNGAMLETYFNTFLKNTIGGKSEEWSNEDYERAAGDLEQQAEYIPPFFLKVRMNMSIQIDKIYELTASAILTPANLLKNIKL